MKCFAAMLCAAGLCASASQRGLAEPAPFMMRTTVGGQRLEGQPLAWSDQQMLLLGRDGALHEFHPADAKDAEKFGRGYASYSTAEMQARLAEEFGREYTTTASQHFIVVHPRGGGDWAPRLEALYNSFVRYMSVRGFQPSAPAGPLPAVVFRNEADYYDHAEAGGARLAPGTVGHYDPKSNRVFLFDAGDGADLSASAATIIHEATHQAAYNVGVHRRFAEQPRWAVEGLAMMFEAPGVWNSSSLDERADRINRERLDYFRRTGDLRPADWMVRLLGSDRSFQADALNAYAEAWTLSFYLCETRPQEYSSYLQRVAARPAFSQYPPLERMTDFTAEFGADFPLLTAQLQRFVDELP